MVSAGERGDFVIFLPDEFPDSMWMNSLTLRRKQKIHTTHAQPAAFVEIFINTRGHGLTRLDQPPSRSPPSERLPRRI